MVWSRCTWPVSRNPGRVTEVDYADLATVATGSLVWMADPCCAWTLIEVGGSATSFDFAILATLSKESRRWIADQFSIWYVYRTRISVIDPDSDDLVMIVDDIPTSRTDTRNAWPLPIIRAGVTGFDLVGVATLATASLKTAFHAPESTQYT